jgi:CheY-like chemotaxis protein
LCNSLLDVTALRILVVDDDPDIRRLAALSLGRIGGFEVTLAAGGHEAIALAAREIPDLILLDVSMPELDGTQTLRALRAIPATERIPIVFFTAATSEAETVRLGALGAVGVVAKPFDVEDLPRRIRGIMSGLAVH